MGEAEGPAAENVDIVGLGDGERAVAATQTGTTAQITLWSLSGDGKSLAIQDQLSLSNASSVKVIALSPTRIVTAIRTTGETLSLSVWEIAGGKFKPDPLATGSTGWLGLFDLARLSSHQFIIAVQMQNGRMKIIAWVLREIGGGGGSDGSSTTFYELVRNGEDERGEVSAISVVATEDKNGFAVAVRQKAGTLKVLVYEAIDGSLARRKDQEYVPVVKGELIAKMGNSGSASGPHMHIQADRVQEKLLGDIDDLTQRVRNGETVSVIRPLQFHGAEAMKIGKFSDVKMGGVATNPRAPMDGGVYFSDHVVLPNAW